tara:strand:- start:57 stop:1409 length:1353 start_codon:yes stop_codon:yes gene_type:complete
MTIQQMMLGHQGEATVSNYSVDFDGDDYLNIPEDTDFELGTTNFTAEAWYYADSSMNTGQYNTILAMGWPFQLYWHNKQFKFWASSAGASGNYFVNGSSFNTGDNTAPQDGWNHVAVSRSGSTFRMFLNGELMSTATDSTGIGDPEDPSSIGRFAPNDNLYATGKVSNLRYIKGTALYTSYFIPSATALTSVTNTKLLCCNGSTVTGSTVTPTTITAVGNPQSSTSNPFNQNSHSVNFDGSGDYLSVAAASALTFGTGDFAIEFWAKADNFTNRGTFYDGRGSSNYEGVTIGHESSSGEIRVYMNASSGTDIVVEDNGTFTTGSWYHIAVTRSSGTVRLFINGALKDSATRTSDLSHQHGKNIGYKRYDASSYDYFDGKISNLRVVKGAALYTSAFTVPTEPLYVTTGGVDPSNVRLLCCNQATTTESSKRPADISAFGNVSVSTDTPFA